MATDRMAALGWNRYSRPADKTATGKRGHRRGKWDAHSRQGGCTFTTAAIQRNFMAIDQKTRWCQARQVAGTSMYIENPLTDGALEMVVVAVVSYLIHGRALRQVDLMKKTLFSHRFESPVHGRNPQPR
ncbi:Uncharacterised protein [Comamonas testosteroni]|uniref:Uncharacterized protein n=1 Tax=Comamonas testosteroni TaxID=285 RepID=A0A8B4S608_COMTE|nr:Uncharacterised protein [Comamonas testosteroni]